MLNKGGLRIELTSLRGMCGENSKSSNDALPPPPPPPANIELKVSVSANPDTGQDTYMVPV